MDQPPLIGGLELLVHPVNLLLLGKVGAVPELSTGHRLTAEGVVHASACAQAARAFVMGSPLHSDVVLSSFGFWFLLWLRLTAGNNGQNIIPNPLREDHTRRRICQFL